MLLSFFLLMSLATAQTEVRSLSGEAPLSLVSGDESKKLFVIFQKDCQSCRKQVQDLDCLKDQYQISLLGAFSTEEQLREEYRRMRTNYPAYYADRKALQKLAVTQPATPQILAFIGAKKFHHLGLKNCHELQGSLIKGTRHEP